MLRLDETCVSVEICGDTHGVEVLDDDAEVAEKNGEQSKECMGRGNGGDCVGENTVVMCAV